MFLPGQQRFSPVNGQLTKEVHPIAELSGVDQANAMMQGPLKNTCGDHLAHHFYLPAKGKSKQRSASENIQVAEPPCHENCQGKADLYRRKATLDVYQDFNVEP